MWLAVAEDLPGVSPGGSSCRSECRSAPCQMMPLSRVIVLAALGSVGALAFAAACSGPSETIPSGPLDTPSKSIASNHNKSDASLKIVCNGSATEGCPCDNEQEMVDCGRVYHKSGDYVTCSQGFLTCADGGWSACIGDNIILP
jgi:hypothetical protein